MQIKYRQPLTKQLIKTEGVATNMQNFAIEILSQVKISVKTRTLSINTLAPEFSFKF
jgi:hypothetical protein